MKHLSLLAIALLLTACAPAHSPVVRIDLRIQPIVNQWHSDAIEILGHDIVIFDLIIDISDLPEHVGACEMEDYHTPHVYIDQKYWDKSDDIQRLLDVYHEMGHCVLLREHNSTLIFINDPGVVPYYAPASIMYPATMIRDDYWLGHRIALLTEYFTVK